MAALRVVSPAQLVAQDQKNASDKAAADDAAAAINVPNTNLGAFLDSEFSRFARHRDGAYGWTDRIAEAMRMFQGLYDPTKLAQIQKFGGSTIYARIVASKARGASSLLRDVYLNTEMPWGLKPTPDPTLPDPVMEQIQNLVSIEVKSASMMGQSPDPSAIRDRIGNLYAAAKQAAIKKARDEAKAAQNKVDDLLVEGNFYQALAECLVDIPLFPFCCFKGPVVRVVPQVKWQGGKAQLVEAPKMFWYRVSPYDLWWTPGVSNIADAAVIERTRLTRVDLNQLLGLPGYDEAAIRNALDQYGRTGYVMTNLDSSMQSRAVAEHREGPQMNESGVIDLMEYHGYVQGKMLLEYGLPAKMIPDPLRDYFVDIFKIGVFIIKVQLSPSVRKRPPYYMTSFEKVPGTVLGNALPEILSDIQDGANSALRSLINNMAISSGPQVVIDDERVPPNENSDDLYPWKRWHAQKDMMGTNSSPPVEFFQPTSNAQELLGVFEKFSLMADDMSAIPRYVTGSDRLGGAGRTASGLAMLMGNAAKILQTVAANIDKDMIGPALQELYDMIMLTDTTGMLRGDESIEVLGVKVAMQRETQRQRALEFLQITANPIDAPIMGVKGRAAVLRAVSDDLGLDGVNVVPPDDELDKMAAAGPPPGAQPPKPGGAPGGVSAPGDPSGPVPDTSGAQMPTPTPPAQGNPAPVNTVQ